MFVTGSSIHCVTSRRWFQVQLPPSSVATGMRILSGSTSTGPNRKLGAMRASASAIHCRRMPTSLRGSTPLVALTNPCGTTSSVRPTACPGHTETIGSGDTNGCVIGERGVAPGCRSSAKALWNSATAPTGPR